MTAFDRDPATVLREAYRRDPENEFVLGCYSFFKAHGFLSANQITALNRVENTPARNVAYSLGHCIAADEDGGWE